MTPDVTNVGAADWRSHIVGRINDGYEWLDFLTAIDRGTTIEVVVRLVNPESVHGATIVTTIPAEDPVLDSIVPVAPGADWYEREAGEMFGITFTGHPDPRPLLTRGDGPPPLRKSVPLPARLETPWPGADDEIGRAGSRRRAQPPGVLETWERE